MYAQITDMVFSIAVKPTLAVTPDAHVNGRKIARMMGPNPIMLAYRQWSTQRTL
jgi:hypothetical protein